MNDLHIETIGKPEKWLVEAAGAVGLDYSGLTHEVTSHFKNHVIKRHGDPAKQGTATIQEADFDKIPGIIQSPDMAIIGAARYNGRYNIYAKAAEGVTYLYFEEVLNSRRNKALRSSTLYKVTRPLSPDEVVKNVAGTGKTDISTAKILTFTRA